MSRCTPRADACPQGTARRPRDARAGCTRPPRPRRLPARGVFNPGTGVVGAIAMWGRVVEHGRGARSEFAYPARLRLVCGSCLAEGSGAVAPVEVVDSGGVLTPFCRKHLAARNGRTVAASAIEAELLSTFGVELLPIERVDRSLRIRQPLGAAVGDRRARTSRPGVIPAGECRSSEHDAPARRRNGALDRVRDHRRRRSGRCSGTTDASPTAMVVVPPSAQPIDDVTDTVTVGARPIVDDRPDAERRSAAHHGPGVPPDRVPVRRRQREPAWTSCRAGTARGRCSGSGSARLRTGRHGLREGMGRLLARSSVLGLLGAVHGSSRRRTMGALGEPVVRARRRRRSDP